MATRVINVQMLAKMFLAGAQSIEAKKDYINELNVFPVPDGDTGTNMSLTIMAAAKEVMALDLETLDIMQLAKAISSGSLRGARGNSGVILSQLFRGFTKSIREEKEIDVQAVTHAFQRAKDTAYKAVMKPKEGTILTVARGLAEKAEELAEEVDDLEVFFPAVLAYAEEVLADTPNMLKVLKDAGVVDSGGQGLVEILRGAYDVFLGKEVDYSALPKDQAAPSRETKGYESEADIRFGYCTEFIILLSKPFTNRDEEEFKSYLGSLGDSLVCVADEEIVKIHVHTNDPGLVIQKGLSYGELSRLKIDNMREEHREMLIQNTAAVAKKAPEPIPNKPVGFIAVSIGEGLNNIFTELGVDYIIEGGQTMNPSTEDLLQAIKEVRADAVFILPNNKNIILAANQARELTKDKEIIVVPTKTVPQGITAVINYNMAASVEENTQLMNEEIKRVKTGQVTYAVRDTRIEDVDIHEGDIMGLGDHGILAVGDSIDGTTKEMLSKLVDEDSELISLYYGEEIQAEEAKRVISEIEVLYPDLDVDAHFGGQPIYYYILAVE